MSALESEETPPATLQDAIVAQVITQAFAQSLTEERPVPFNWNNPLGLSDNKTLIFLTPATPPSDSAQTYAAAHRKFVSYKSFQTG